MSSISLEQFDNGGTVTREEFRRLRSNGNGAATPPADPPVVERLCLECSTPLSAVQVKRGGKFCGARCSGTHAARIGNNTAPKSPPTLPPEREALTNPAAPLGLHPDDQVSVNIAAAFVAALLALPACRLVEVHVGPVGPIEVRR